MTRRAFIKLASTAAWAFTPSALTPNMTFYPMKDQTDFDVIIIGGSYAGLSAAMTLGRSLRSVMIIDSGNPCNKQTPHSHNFITQDGEKPHVIAERARTQVLKYQTVVYLKGLVVHAAKEGNGFRIVTQKGETFESKKLLFATGIKDQMPDIDGFADCWGISVVHCPYCHGYEIRNQKTGIMANGQRAFHLASLVRNLTPDLTILTSGKADFTEEQLLKLDKNGVTIIENPISGIDHQNGYIRQVVFDNGSKENFTAAYAAVPFVQHSDLPASLGCELTEQGLLQVDMFQKTTVSGVFACGDNANPMRSVAFAVSSGTMAGAKINMELTEEIF
ncbi:thioredoxin reductase [Dyadobacter jejuensis]|uniref:Thioredoxin reductase n=1 Tax=Dyadobacter jejuensis TaxID=1082580 RepID=A0A316AJJ4_9BACT|nr:NAD(P)/FAD-dependent oxidoreductase [Dyadobacter jejuensis]PWJ57040.1 thioredoxin reductase [Dyadobacter jejuensis]